MAARRRYEGPAYYRPLFHHTPRSRTGCRRHDPRLASPAGRSVHHRACAFEGFLIKNGIDAVLGGRCRDAVPTPSPTRRSNPHAHRYRVCWCCGGARWADPHRLFHRNLPRPPAAEAKQDPVALRLRPSTSTRATRRCCALPPTRPAGARCCRGQPGERRGWGVAVHESFHSYVAQVAEVTVKTDGSACSRPHRRRGGLRHGHQPGQHPRASRRPGRLCACRPRCTGKSRLATASSSRANFGDYNADPYPNAEGRGAHRRLRRKPHRHRRTRRASSGAAAVANAIAATGKWATRLPFSADDPKA